MAQANLPVYNNVTTAQLQAGFNAAKTSIGTFFSEFKNNRDTRTPDERGLTDRFVVEMKKHVPGIHILHGPGVHESYTGFDVALSYNLNGTKTTVYLQAKKIKRNQAVDFAYKNKLSDQFQLLDGSARNHRYTAQDPGLYQGSVAYAGYIIYGEGTTLFISLIDAWEVLQKYGKKKNGNYTYSNTLAGRDVWENKNEYGLDNILCATEESPYGSPIKL